MQEEYDFDHSKPGQQLCRKVPQESRTVVLDEDVADDFPSAESVNEALRSLQHRTILQEVDSKK